MEVFEGQSRYEIQLWWEIQPFVRSTSTLREPEARNEIKEEEEEGAHAGESMRSAGSSWEKIDGTEHVPSRRERLSKKQSDEEDPWTNQFCGVGQGSGLVQRESRSGHLYGLVLSGHQSPVQSPRPKANSSGTSSGQPTLRAFGKLTRPTRARWWNIIQAPQKSKSQPYLLGIHK